MTIYDYCEAVGVLAIDYNAAPKTIKLLNQESESADWVVLCRVDMQEEGEALAMRLTDYDYETFPFGNYIIHITRTC